MEEYKLVIFQVCKHGVHDTYEKICDLIMCKNCESWHQKEDSYGSCDVLGLITYENFACIDGIKKEE